MAKTIARAFGTAEEVESKFQVTFQRSWTRPNPLLSTLTSYYYYLYDKLPVEPFRRQ
jgi:hypothetical protein